MVLTNKVAFSTSGPLEKQGSLAIWENKLFNEVGFLQTGDLNQTLTFPVQSFYQEIKLLSLEITGELLNTSRLVSYLSSKDSILNLILATEQHTDLTAFSVPTKVVENIDLFISEAYPYRQDKAVLVVRDRSISDFGYTYRNTFNEVETEIELRQLDIRAPELIRVVPLSADILISPSTDIIFELKDPDDTPLLTSSINFYINDVLIVSGNLNVAPSGFGSTVITQIAPYHFSYQFIPTNNWSQGGVVSVSGVASDAYTPPHSGSYSFSFRILDTDSLVATIIGTPDIEAPYLKDLDPMPGQTIVPVNTNILLTVFDDATGVNKDSVSIRVDNKYVINGGNTAPYSDYADTTITPILDKGFQYTIDLVQNLKFNRAVTIEVSAVDKATPPNEFLDLYTFFTQPNEHLTASGFSVLTHSGYVPVEADISFTTTLTGSHYRVYYYNISGTGLDLINSSVQINDTTVSSIILETISGYEYQVEFDLVPNYSTQGDLIFHVQQSGTVSGIALYSDIPNTLLWGYEYCYSPDPLFETDKKIEVLAKVKDRGYYPTEGSNFLSFTTVPKSSANLGAYVLGINPPATSLSGSYMSNNAYFERGKTMKMELEVKDLAGNTLVYPFEFKIEE